MGLYLNSKKPHNNYQEIVKSDYFVDKTGLLEELIPIVGPGLLFWFQVLQCRLR